MLGNIGIPQNSAGALVHHAHLSAKHGCRQKHCSKGEMRPSHCFVIQIKEDAARWRIWLAPPPLERRAGHRSKSQQRAASKRVAGMPHVFAWVCGCGDGGNSDDGGGSSDASSKTWGQKPRLWEKKEDTGRHPPTRAPPFPRRRGRPTWPVAHAVRCRPSPRG
jgi:hypothetical protein